MESQFLCDEQFQTKEFQCPVCSKYFSRKFTLDVHLLIHKGVKPYPCPFCGKCFRQKGTLMRHKALHSLSNLFHCKLCNHGFRQKNMFLYHLKHRHNVTTETLDRRKYRTELKDHQSIMDTLPSFVQADSTAIASSEKQLDAMLFESLDNNTGVSRSVVKIRKNGEKILLKEPNILNLEPENISVNSDKHFTELDSQKSGSFGYQCGLCLQIFINYTSFKHHIEKDHNNNEMLYDTKPIEISKVTSHSNLVECSSKQNNDDLKSCNSVYDSNTISKVLNSNNVNEDVNLCVICQQSFETREEFETHILIHVRNIESTETSEKNQFVLSNSTTLSNSGCLKENTFHFVSSTSGEENKPVDKVIQICENSNRSQTDCLVSNLKDEINPNSCTKLLTKNKITEQGTLSNSNSNLEKLNKNPKQSLKVLKSKPHVFKSNSPDLSHNYCNLYKCKLCAKYFQNKLSMEYHKQLHLSFKGFNCGLCSKYFVSKSLLLSHTRLSHMKNFSCSSCSKTFQYRTLYLQHIKLCRNNSSPFKNLKDLNLPITSIDHILKSDTEGIVGIIPLSYKEGSNEDMKFCIPIISLAAVKKQPNVPFLNSFVKISDLQK